ncbi:MAG: hypothetical protein V1646_04835 [bacterium]
MFFTKIFFDKRFVFLIFFVLISFFSLNLSGMWWGAVDPDLPQGTLESDKSDAQISFYRIKSPVEYSINIYRWKENVDWFGHSSGLIGWTNPICGYCAAFYALQMGKTFERKHDATYQEFVDSFYETDNTDPLTYVNYKPTKADTVDKGFLSEGKFSKILDSVKELHDLSSLTHPSRPDQKLPNPIKSKFHHFCQQAYNLIDTSNPNQSGWIAQDDIESMVKILYPESIKDRTVVLSISQDLPETQQRAIDLIRQVDENQSKYAILIYFDGNNHWGAGLIRKATAGSKLELIFAESVGFNFGHFLNSNSTIKQVLVKQALDQALRTPPDTLEKWLEKAKNTDFALREFERDSLKLNYLMESEIWKNKSRELQGVSTREIDTLNQQISNLESDLERQRTGNVSSEEQLRRSASELENIKISLQQKIADFLSSNPEYQTLKFLENDSDTPLYDRQQAKTQREAMEDAVEQNSDFKRQNSSLIQRKEQIERVVQQLQDAIQRNQTQIAALQGQIQNLREQIAQKRESSDLLRTWLIPALAQENIKENNRGLFSALEDWWDYIHPKCLKCNREFNETDRIPIFLPCEPIHILCFPCFSGETASNNRMARGYDGEKRTGKIFIPAICSKPVSQEFIDLARKQETPDQKIQFSFATAKFYKQPSILADLPEFQKFSAENVLIRVKDVLKTHLHLENAWETNALAAEIKHNQNTLIYPIEFPTCNFVAFINYGRPPDTSNPFKPNEEFKNNSDDIIFKSTWYGASLNDHLLANANSPNIKHPGVKTKLNFLLTKLSKFTTQREQIINYLELLLWLGIPILKLTPLLDMDDEEQQKNKLKNIYLRLCQKNASILNDLRTVGNTARHYRINDDQNNIKIFDRQEWTLLNTLRQIILQIIKSENYKTDTITDDNKISLDAILPMEESKQKETVSSLPRDKRKSLEQVAKQKKNGLEAKILTICKGLNPSLTTYTQAVTWKDKLDYDIPEDAELGQKLFQKNILTEMGNVTKLDELISLLEISSLPKDERIRLAQATKQKQNELKAKILDFCKGLKPSLTTYTQAVAWKDQLDDGITEDAALNLKLSQNNILTEMSNVIMLDKRISLLEFDYDTVKEQQPQAVINIPRIFDFSKITSELVIQLATVDDFVRENEIANLSQEKIEALVLESIRIQIQTKTEDNTLEQTVDNIVYPKTQYYAFDATNKLPDANLRALETWSGNYMNLAKLNDLNTILIAKIKDRESLDAKIEALKKTLPKKTDVLQEKLNTLKVALVTLKQKLVELNGKMVFLKNKITRKAH